MTNLPHRYAVRASAESEGDVRLESEALPALATAPPAEFGGPGDRWSPETLLVGAVADCFVLSFRAIARASHLDWERLECDAVGVLDRAERVTRFTQVTIRARLRLPAGGDAERGRRLLEKAERTCFVTNSLVAEATLDAEVAVG